MEKILILLAGYPGTGKTYLGTLIKKKGGTFYSLSQDKLKECYCDMFGFKNLDEKKNLEEKAWNKYYQLMEYHMQQNDNIMSDYPFSEKQRPKIQQLAEKYEYRVVTIRLVADLDILYERQRLRDLDSDRHLSHIMKSYRNGDQLSDRTQADNLLTYDEFIRRCKTRGYDQFALGKVIEVDVTDFSNVNYEQIVEEIFTNNRRH